MTWGGVNYGIIFILGKTNPLNAKFPEIPNRTSKKNLPKIPNRDNGDFFGTYYFDVQK